MLCLNHKHYLRAICIGTASQGNYRRSVTPLGFLVSIASSDRLQQWLICSHSKSDKAKETYPFTLPEL